MTIANVKNKDILLDTNIIISCGDKSFGTEARNILKKLVDNKNSLAISEITPFEILRKDLDDNDENYYTKLISDKRINIIPLSTSVLINASILCREQHPKKETENKNIICDMLIGGTVMSNKEALLLTSDRKDFNKPYWKIISEEKIIRKKQEGWELNNIFLLQFDYCALNPKHQNENVKRACLHN